MEATQAVGGTFATGATNTAMDAGNATGTVKWFNNAKGWGFIRDEAGTEIFVHYSQIRGEGFKTLREGQTVRYTLKTGPKGPLAEEVFPQS